ncbi:Cytochrome P450 6a2 [Gryllus bimaculatus]|nr:Cytochrome P450 6a2 [Gryllus bimaculatus]
MRDRVLLRQSALELFHDFYWRLDGLPFGGVYQITRPALFIRDPELIKQILVKDFACFQDRGIFVDEQLNPLSAHLFNLGGARWKQLRSKLTPTFTSGKMKLMFACMHDCARELALLVQEEAARAGGLVEIKEVLAKFTTDVIGSCAFGLRCNSMRNPDSQFRAMGRRAFDPTLGLTLRTMATILMPSVAALLKVHIPEKDVSDFFLNVVKETMDYREKNNVKRNDFFQMLIQMRKEREAGPSGGRASGEGAAARDGGDLELTDNLLAAQAFVFFLAGFETSSAAMSFTLHELALNPDVQRKLRREINAVVEKHDGHFTYESVMNIEYLEKVICETLRKYPPLSALVRECNAAYTIPGTKVVLESGTRVLIPVHAVQNDPAFFPEPQRYDPERFGERERARRPGYTYLPFGEGPRLCIGMRFGQLQTKLGLAILLHRYHFATCDKTNMPLKFDPKSFLTTSVGGMWLKNILNGNEKYDILPPRDSNALNDT